MRNSERRIRSGCDDDPAHPGVDDADLNVVCPSTCVIADALRAIWNFTKLHRENIA